MLGASAVGCDLSSVAKFSDKQSSSKQNSIEEPKSTVEDFDDDDDEFSEGLTSNQKCALGFIWFVSGVYSVMSQQILTKEKEVHCTLRAELTDKFNFISLFVAIGKKIR